MDIVAPRLERGPLSESGDPLGELRRRLDTIDMHLLKTLDDRFSCCRLIAEVKRDNNIPMMQPDRVGIVVQRARRYAEDHDLNPEFVAGLYESIIAETCRVEDRIITGS